MPKHIGSDFTAPGQDYEFHHYVDGLDNLPVTITISSDIDFDPSKNEHIDNLIQGILHAAAFLIFCIRTLNTTLGRTRYLTYISEAMLSVVTTAKFILSLIQAEELKASKPDEDLSPDELFGDSDIFSWNDDDEEDDGQLDLDPPWTES